MPSQVAIQAAVVYSNLTISTNQRQQSLNARITHPIVLFEFSFKQQTICITSPLNSLTHNTNNSSAPLLNLAMTRITVGKTTVQNSVSSVSGSCGATAGANESGLDIALERDRRCIEFQEFLKQVVYQDQVLQNIRKYEFSGSAPLSGYRASPPTQTVDQLSSLPQHVFITILEYVVCSFTQDLGPYGRNLLLQSLKSMALVSKASSEAVKSIVKRFNSETEYLRLEDTGLLDDESIVEIITEIQS
ncbi:hypothetical protein PHYPSEUDO_014395 [Phytophthora pseudosyringae]|uniref:Uncharacterized protein n=1 Tax=Phytophthora pseudosyringae TaxID=221518 RepID=A0A8T1W213_9STRA|nr:hypothetical protein PHYPSEUDO_014395 [Phytophthora pseudosyringae]